MNKLNIGFTVQELADAMAEQSEELNAADGFTLDGLDSKQFAALMVGMAQASPMVAFGIMTDAREAASTAMFMFAVGRRVGRKQATTELTRVNV